MGVKLVIESELLATACLEATRAWVETEHRHVKKFSQPDGLNIIEFEAFLKDWMVVRNTAKAARSEFLKYISTVRFDQPEAVENIAIIAAKRKFSSKNGKHILPTSMISKIAFCKSPEKFTPIDRWAVLGIKKFYPDIVKSTITSHFYATYYKHFLRFVAQVENRIATEDWNNETFAFGNETIASMLFARRVADKYLMILGGGMKVETIEKLNATKRTFSDDAYSLLTTHHVTDEL